jgi:hypothetical protein
VSGPDGEPTLADVQDEFPGWECYVSFGWHWATLRDDPDVRVRGEDTTDLRDMINRWTGLHGNGDTGV